jgi:DNA-binding GntR family transcriptional regulator
MVYTERNGSTAKQMELRTWLERRIAEGDYSPGDRIDEQAICRSFGVSRTPLREALLQLSSVGLVVFRPRQGAIVAQMSVRQIAAMWEVLTHLEGLCASLCARRMTDSEVGRLKSIHEGGRPLLATNEVLIYAEANRAFHEVLYEGCRNDYLSVQVKGIRTRLNAYRRYPFQRAGGIERSFKGHQSVLDAIAAGNVDAADLAMREHVSGGLSFLDVVAELRRDVVREPPNEVRGKKSLVLPVCGNPANH